MYITSRLTLKRGQDSKASASRIGAESALRSTFCPAPT